METTLIFYAYQLYGVLLSFIPSPRLTAGIICLGQHRSSPNNDFLGSTPSGKVGPVWSSSDKPLLEVETVQ